MPTTNGNTPTETTLVVQPNYVKLSLITMGLVALFYALYAGQAVVVPLLFALLLAMLLDPLVGLMQRVRVPRVIAVLVAVVFAMLLLAALGYFIISQAMSFGHDLPDLEKKITALGASIQRWAQETFNMDRRELNSAVEKVKDEGMATGGSMVGTTLTTVGTLFAFFFLLPVFTFLILYYKRLLLGFFAKLFPAQDHSVVHSTLGQTRGVVQSYLLGLILEAGIVTLLSWIGLMVLGVPHALLLAVIAAVLNLIPYIGMIIATILPALIAVVTLEPIAGLWVVALYAGVQFIDNNLIVPRVVGARVKLNALISLIAVMIGGALWGIPGMFLALPITAILKVIFDHAPGLRPFGYLLGDEEPDPDRNIFKGLTQRDKAKTAHKAG